MGSRVICHDCRLAETDLLHPVLNDLPCCEARNLMIIPKRHRRNASQKLKNAVDPEYWQLVLDRLTVLINAERVREGRAG